MHQHLWLLKTKFQILLKNRTYKGRTGLGQFTPTTAEVLGFSRWFSGVSVQLLELYSQTYPVSTTPSHRGGCATLFAIHCILQVGGLDINPMIAIWLQNWTEADEQGSNKSYGYYLGIYALLVVLANAGTAGECW